MASGIEGSPFHNQNIKTRSTRLYVLEHRRKQQDENKAKLGTSSVACGAQSESKHTDDDKSLDPVVSENSDDNVLLLQAATSGDNKTMKKILTANKQSSIRDAETGDTPLVLASRGGHTSTVRLLLRHGADVNERGGGGFTALMAAADSGQTEIVRLLVGCPSCDVHLQNDKGDTALKLACSGGYSSIVGVLLTTDVDVNVKNHIGNTPVLEASSGGHLQIVKNLVHRGADVTCQNKFGCTPLMTAASGGHSPLVKFLLGQGVAVNVENYLGNTATALAATSPDRKPEIVRMLVKHGGDINLLNHSHTPIVSLAVAADDLRMVKCLVALGADVNGKDDQGRTPLMHATSHACGDIVDFLIKKGADVNGTDKEGNTAVNKLVSQLTMRKACPDRPVRRDMVIKLLRSGADVGTGPCESTSFFFTRRVAQGERALVQLMVTRGAHPRETHFQPMDTLLHHSALFTALKHGHADIARYLCSIWFFSPFDLQLSPRDREYGRQVRIPPCSMDVYTTLYCQARPWSLTCLAFVSLSHVIGFQRGREARVGQLPVPEMIKQKLLYKDDQANIPTSQWATLTFSVW